MGRHQVIVNKSLVKISREVTKANQESQGQPVALALHKSKLTPRNLAQEVSQDPESSDFDEESEEMKIDYRMQNIDSNSSNESQCSLRINGQVFEPNLDKSLDKSKKMMNYK